MNYVTTNIRLPEEDYIRLKDQATRERKSLAEVIRVRLGVKTRKRSKAQVRKLLVRIDKLAHENAKHLKGFDSLKVLREMRYGGKW